MGLFDLFRQPKQFSPDGQVLSQLKKAGSNLSKPHDVEFFLYFPTESIAEQAASQIRTAGFAVEVKPAAKGNDWLCFATRRMVPDIGALEQIRKDFTNLTTTLGGEYDGWGTGVVN